MSGIVRGDQVGQDLVLRPDVCVVGSGPGGAMMASRLAEAGAQVVVLEEGGYHQKDEFDMQEATAYPRLYQDRGNRATADLSISVLQGRAVGGGTVVNWTTSFRTPDRVLACWREQDGLSLTAEMLRPHGYRNYMIGKWHVTPLTEAGATGPFDGWPLARGFDRFYGFMDAETDHYAPELVRDNSSIDAQQRSKPIYEGADLSGLRNIQSSAMTWDYAKRIRDATKMKCVLKGILAWEDAKLAAENGFDGIIVSNHGGRSDEAGRSTIESLQEIIEVSGSMPVFIDSGFRRGTDIVKALSMGARGVAIGRPYLWGLGAFGEAGVTRVLEILRTELRAAMQQAGAPTIKHLVPAMVKHV